ncbi:MAG: phage tail protein, partial [Pseudomonadota bacterium]
IQRRYLETFLDGFSETPKHGPSFNSVSLVDGRPMVDLDRIYAYAWDARPYPQFPHDTETWSDGDNWFTGHWLNGRASATALDATISAMAADFGHAPIDVNDVRGLVAGLVVDRVMSLREAMQPLELATFLDFFEAGDRIRAIHRDALQMAGALTLVTRETAVESKPDAPLIVRTRAQETELPERAKIAYISRDGSYASEVAEAQYGLGQSQRVSQATLAVMLEAGEASRIAESWMRETWKSRDRATVSLPPSRIAVEPGDAIFTDAGLGGVQLRVTDVSDGTAREVQARATDPTIYTAPAGRARAVALPDRPIIANPNCIFLDLPLLSSTQNEAAGFLAVSQTPWPGAMAVLRSPTGVGYARVATAIVPAITGLLKTELKQGPVGRLDHANSFDVELAGGSLSSASTDVLLNGANAAAVETGDGSWEVIQFEQAELIGPRRYRLSRLLRGQLGTDVDQVAFVPVGARFVLIDQRLVQLDLAYDDVLRPMSWRVVKSGRSFGETTPKQTEHAFAGRGLRPLSPVHVRGTALPEGRLISWVRRTRIDGDNWEAVEVPLGEETEAYEVDILVGGTVVRSFTTNVPSLVYPAADIVNDFGTASAAVAVRVYQTSTRVGRGGMAEAVV